MKLQSLLLILLSFTLYSCTREAPDLSRLSLHIPQSASAVGKAAIVQSKSNGLSALSTLTKWGLSAPAEFAEINCFAVMIYAPEISTPEINNCSDSDHSVMATPQYIQGGFLPDTDQVIEVPTGLNRTIYLVGFHTTDTAECTNLDGNTSAQRFSSANFSPPMLLAQTTMDLKGGDINVDMSVPSTLSSAMKFEDCLPASFSGDVSPTEPTALVVTGKPASVTSTSTNTFIIGGPFAAYYKYAFNTDADCSLATYSGYFPVGAGNPITHAAGSETTYRICLIGKAASGEEQTVPTTFTWTYDATPPAGITSVSRLSTYSTVSTVAVFFSGIPADAAMVGVYSNNACSAGNRVAYVTAAEAMSASGVVLSGQSDGAHTYYARAFDEAGNAGACSTTHADIFIDTAQPFPPGGLLGSSVGTFREFTPYYTWDVSIDPGGASASGVDWYEVAFGTGTSASQLSNMVGWIPVAKSFSASLYNSSAQAFIDGVTYTFSVRSVDKAGNRGIPATTAFTYKATGAKWSMTSYIKPANSDSYDHFGQSVATDGEYMVVGAPAEASNYTGVENLQATASLDNSYSTSGAVYVFKKVSGSWVQFSYLKAPDTWSGDRFGSSVAISGDTIVVGAPGERSSLTSVNNGSTAILVGDTDTSYTDVGAVYVYRRDANDDWAPEAYLKADDAAAMSQFGQSVAIKGNVIVVGASGEQSSSGAVYVFDRVGTNWSQTQKLKRTGYQSSENFGQSVSFDGLRIAVGAPYEGANGAVHIFSKSTTWQDDQTVTAPNGGSGDQFGYSVQIWGDRLVVGAPYEDNSQRGNLASVSANTGSTDSGAAYVFSYTTAWNFEQYLKPTNSDPYDLFGYSVAMYASNIAVGAIGESSCEVTSTYYPTIIVDDNSCGNTGAVYVYQNNTGTTWTESAYLKRKNTSSAGAANFGNAMSMLGSQISIGSYYESVDQDFIMNGGAAWGTGVLAPESGAVFVFDAKP